MDLIDYVREFIPDQGGEQFAVLAFDLNLSLGKHRPPLMDTLQSFTFHPRQADSLSGPWCARVVNYNKSGLLQGLAEKESFETPGAIHPEELLLHFLPQYLMNFYLKYGAMPQSVCLYSLYSPCERCNRRLRTVPSRTFEVNFGTYLGVEHWLLAFDRTYSQSEESYNEITISKFRQSQLDGDEKALRSQYPNAVIAMERALSLRPGGWSVVKSE